VARPLPEGKKHRIEQVELEAGTIDVPSFAILDGVMTNITTDVTDRGGKRTIDFIFPYFADSLVYDPLVVPNTSEKAKVWLALAEERANREVGSWVEEEPSRVIYFI
jgi:hypothetical protein